MASQEQFATVQSWLQSIYGPNGAPDFEINEQTAAALFQLATVSQINTASANLVLQDTKQHIESYKNKSNELDQIIASIGLPAVTELVKSASSSSVTFDDPDKQVLVELVRITASMAAALKLATTDTSAIMEAISDLDLQRFTIEEDQLYLQEKKAQITAMYKETSEMRQLLQRLASNWDQELAGAAANNQERIQNIKYLETKTKEYSSTLQTLKDTLKRNGAQSSIYHGTLQQLHDSLAELETQNAEKQAQLDGFKQLPPDPSLAKLKIEEAAAYLLSLENKISQSVNSIQLLANM